MKMTQISEHPRYLPPVGKTVAQVEEIVILKNINHSIVPNVKILEYKIPGLSNSNPSLTTGQLVKPSNGGIKTVYDPVFWTDPKLKKAAQEALIDNAKKRGSVNDGQFRGVTKEGYNIEGYIKNGNIDTFYFL